MPVSSGRSSVVAAAAHDWVLWCPQASPAGPSTRQPASKEGCSTVPSAPVRKEALALAPAAPPAPTASGSTGPHQPARQHPTATGLNPSSTCACHCYSLTAGGTPPAAAPVPPGPCWCSSSWATTAAGGAGGYQMLPALNRWSSSCGHSHAMVAVDWADWTGWGVALKSLVAAAYESGGAVLASWFAGCV